MDQVVYTDIELDKINMAMYGLSYRVVAVAYGEIRYRYRNKQIYRVRSKGPGYTASGHSSCNDSDTMDRSLKPETIQEAFEGAIQIILVNNGSLGVAKSTMTLIIMTQDHEYEFLLKKTTNYHERPLLPIFISHDIHDIVNQGTQINENNYHSLVTIKKVDSDLIYKVLSTVNTNNHFIPSNKIARTLCGDITYGHIQDITRVENNQNNMHDNHVDNCFIFVEMMIQFPKITEAIIGTVAIGISALIIGDLFEKAKELYISYCNNRYL